MRDPQSGGVIFRRDLGRSPSRRGGETPILGSHGPSPRSRWPAAKRLTPGSAAIGPPERSAKTGDRPVAAGKGLRIASFYEASVPYAPALRTHRRRPGRRLPLPDPGGWDGRSGSHTRLGVAPASRRGRQMQPCRRRPLRIRRSGLLPERGTHPRHHGDGTIHTRSLVNWPVSRSRRGTLYSARVRATADTGPAWQSS